MATLTPGEGRPDDYGPMAGIWLNTAQQGPHPKAAQHALDEAAGWKRDPTTMPTTGYGPIADALRPTLARFVGARPDGIVIGDSTSHGIHVIVEGHPWARGDEVIVVRGDFPATSLPWRLLERRGVRVTTIDPDPLRPLHEVLADALSPATRVFATTWVDSFTGRRVDPAALGDTCHDAGARFVCNGSQAVGAVPADVARLRADALVSCGWKWMCGPYGTGFAWIAPDWAETLSSPHAYWLPMSKGRPEGALQDTPFRDDLGLEAFDTFGAGGPTTMHVWNASASYLQALGADAVWAHNQYLVQRLQDGIADTAFRCVTPSDASRRGPFVVVDHDDPTMATSLYTRLREAGVHTVLREGRVRIAPHVHNTVGDVEAALALMAGV